MAVLHIVFMILKIIGILLLVLVGILLLGVLTVYSALYDTRPGGTGIRKNYGGKAGVSWLFHLIFFTVWYDSGEDRAGYEIRKAFRDPGPETFKGPEAAKKTEEKKEKQKLNTLPFPGQRRLMAQEKENGKEAGWERKARQLQTPGDTEALLQIAETKSSKT